MKVYVYKIYVLLMYFFDSCNVKLKNTDLINIKQHSLLIKELEENLVNITSVTLCEFVFAFD